MIGRLAEHGSGAMEEDMGLLAKSRFGEPHFLISAELLETLLAD